MKIEEFINEVRKLNINITNEMLNNLKIYEQFLKTENEKYNLTSIINEEEVYLKHFYDSLTICKSVDLNSVDSLLDIGTGAGFPGLVIKIFFPHIKVVLLDSNNKKVYFLTVLVKKLLLKNVEIVNQRSEKYAIENYNKFDIVTSRAVAKLHILCEIGLPMVKKNGYLIALKGKNVEEINDAKDTILILNSDIESIVNFELPSNQGERNIIKIKKNKETNNFLIRSYEKILKKPLKKTD